MSYITQSTYFANKLITKFLRKVFQDVALYIRLCNTSTRIIHYPLFVSFYLRFPSSRCNFSTRRE